MPLSVAVVGLGFMGTTHAKAWRKVPNVRLAAVVGTLKQDVQGNLPGQDEPLDLSDVDVRAQIEDVLNDPSIDAIDLCLPTYLHASFAIQALNAGKHVLVEKPMALTETDCDLMITAARSSGKLLMVGHVLRFWGEYQPLMEAVRSGSLGPLRSLHLIRRCSAPAWGGWLRDPTKSGGGVFDLLIHDVDLCIAMLGMPQAISANGRDDSLGAFLHYEGIEPVGIGGGWVSEGVGKFVMAYIANFPEGKMSYVSDQSAPILQRGLETEHLAGGTVDAFQAELSYFAECVQSGRSAARCSMEDSALAVALTRQLIAATKEQGRLVECAQ